MSGLTESILPALKVLELPPPDLDRLGLPAGPLELRRAWPRSPHRLALEYIAGNGRAVAGQWFDDAERLERVARATARPGLRPSTTIAGVANNRVLLQTGGADRRLPGLAPLLARPGTHLVVHRPERRAVVQLETSAGPRFAKVVRPKHVQTLAATGRAVRKLAGAAFLAPELLEVKAASGLLIWSALPGLSLNDLSGSRRLVPAARAAGRALSALHAASPPANATAHSAIDEVGLLWKWLDRLAVFDPELGGRLRVAAAAVFEALAAASASPPVLLHRDFYDKQIFVDAAGRIGLLDFDTLATGEAALDLANALVHFELRVLLGRCHPGRAAAASRAMLDGYRPGPPVRRRLDAYAGATRLRLACVYAFRPYGRPLVPLLLAQVGRPITGVPPRFHSNALHFVN